MSLAVGLSKSRKSPSPFELHAGGVSDLSRALLRAQEAERKRISRELHDEAGQGLMVLRLYLGMLANETKSARETKKIQEAMEMLDRTIGDLRRIIGRLSPRTLEELGLLAAIRKEARELSRTTGMKARVTLPERLQGLDHEYEVAIYRSVQEALNNIAKHSQARKFSVAVERENEFLRLLVEDDGIGFSRVGGISNRSFGIVGMRERIAALGGSLRIRSRKGQGTRVRVLLPVTAAWTHRHDEKLEPMQRERAARSKGKNHRAAEFREVVKTVHQYSNANQMHSS